MRIVARVDESGLFVEDVLVEDNAALPAGCVEARPPAGFHLPRWTGSTWTEGKPAAEILAAERAGKRAEMEAAFAAECGAEFPSPWVAVAALAADPRDARITALRARATKLRDKLAAVDSAATLEAVRAISW